MLIPLNIRVDKRLLRELERFTDEQHLDKAAFLREVIHKGFKNAKQETVLKQYAKKEISVGEACEHLELNRWEFFDLLKAHSAYLNLDLEDLLNASRLTNTG